MPQGRIKWFSPTKGYGFIIADSGDEELFFHYSELKDPKDRPLRKGDRVTYASSAGEKGPKAQDIQLITDG